MGCRGSRSQVAEPAAAKAPEDPKGMKEAMSSKTFLSNVVQTLLPGVRRGLEEKMIEVNATGGLPLFVADKDEDPPYRLRLVKADNSPMKPGEIFDKFSVEVLELRATAAANSEDTSQLPPDVQANAAEVIMIDIEVAIDVSFKMKGNGDTEIGLQLHGERWWSPSLDVGFNVLHVGAHVRIWYGLGLTNLLIAFHKEPEVTWDVEVELGKLGIPLPDQVEDKFMAWSVRKVLAWFDLTNPIAICVKAIEQEVIQEVGEAIEQRENKVLQHLNTI